MSRIDETFKQLRAENKKALIIFLTLGDPSVAATGELVKAAVENGADIIELGIAFSDPLADGPTIQESFHRAIANGANLKAAMTLVEKLRKEGVETPIVYMLASTLVINYGMEKFMRDSAKAGVDGLIIPDAPLEESGEFIPSARNAGLDTIMLAAPTSSEARLKKIAAQSRGFLYYINVTGVTGKTKASPKETGKIIAKFRQTAKIPVCAGFGISDAEQAAAMSKFSDGVIIGSQAVRVINGAKTVKDAARDLGAYVNSIRKGMNGDA